MPVRLDERIMERLDALARGGYHRDALRSMLSPDPTADALDDGEFREALGRLEAAGRITTEQVPRYGPVIFGRERWEGRQRRMAGLRREAAGARDG